MIADYDAQTAVERELVLRLASLLWRLRRATIIETNCLGSTRRSCEIVDQATWRSGREIRHRQIPGNPIPAVQDVQENQTDENSWPAIHSISRSARQPVNSSRDGPISFYDLQISTTGYSERLGRYEAALSRQVARILFVRKSSKVS